MKLTKKEIEDKLQATRPTPQTKINPIELEYTIGGVKRKEVFSDKENLLWALSFQNPGMIRELQRKYPELKVKGFGKSVEVKVETL